MGMHQDSAEFGRVKQTYPFGAMNVNRERQLAALHIVPCNLLHIYMEIAKAENLPDLVPHRVSRRLHVRCGLELALGYRPQGGAALLLDIFAPFPERLAAGQCNQQGERCGNGVGDGGGDDSRSRSYHLLPFTNMLRRKVEDEMSYVSACACASVCVCVCVRVCVKWGRTTG